MEFYYLKRIRIQSNENKIIPLKKKFDFIIGRGINCSYQLLDKTISRNHVLIRKCDDGWTMKNLSNNGLYLNNKLVNESDEISLDIGCIIRIGHSENFYYRFGMKSKQKEKIDMPQRENSDGINNILEDKNDKLVINELESKLKMEEDRKLAILKEKEELAVRLHVDKMNLERRLLQERKEFESKLSKEKEELENKLLKLEEERVHLEEEAQTKEMVLKLKEKEKEDTFEQHLKEFENLKEEKIKLTKRLTEVESDLEDKMLLTSTLEGELMEKQKVDLRLQALIEEKQILERDLQEAKEKGAQVSDLEESLKILEAQKLSLEQEVTNVTSVSESARREVLECVSNVVENEFQCPICNELFITAVVLNCSHTFCKYCIDCWKKNKKDCPNCREPITSETRSLVVDNFIDKIVSTLSENLKKERNQLIDERLVEVNAAKALASIAAASSSRRGRGRGGRGRGGRRNNRGRGAASGRAAQQSSASTSNQVNQYPITVIVNSENRPDPPPITISSSSDNSDSENDNSDSSSESGLSDAYYGGYGHCYNCGRRGHWSNGCPNY